MVSEPIAPQAATPVLPPNMLRRPVRFLRTASGMRSNTLKAATRFFSQWGPVCYLPTATGPRILTCEPAVAQRVLQGNHRNYQKGDRYQLLARLLGQGLLTSNGDFWLRQRRAIQPAFHRQRVNGLVDAMVDVTDKYLGLLQSAVASGQQVDLALHTNQLALNIAAQTLLGVNLESDTYLSFGRALNVCFHEVNKLMVNPLGLPDWLINPGGNKRLATAMVEVNQVVQGIIDLRKAMPNKLRPNDLLTLLLDANANDEEGGMTDQQLIDEVMTLFIAGHETTANALAWLFYLLAQHPDALAKVRAEVETVVGAGQRPTLEQVMRMPWLEQCINEAMRLFPPAWVVGRYVLGDDTAAGYKIPAGANVIISIYHMHRRPDLWPNAEQFMPERFAQGQEHPEYAFLPFGGGPRICIGNHFAMLEMKAVASMFVCRFNWKIIDPASVQPDPVVTLRPKNGIQVQLASIH